MTNLLKIFIMSLMCLTMLGCGGSSDQRDKTTSDYSYQPITKAGFYQDVIMQPNGEFLARSKVEEAVANKGGAYKVDFNEDGKLSKITAIFGNTPINTTWIDTVSRGYKFSTVTLEYQDGYVKYNFKNARMGATQGFYDAYSIRYKIDNENKRIKIAYLYDEKGEQKVNNLGYAQMLFTYDNKGNLIKVGYADTNGKRVTTENKEYETRFVYGNNKKPVEVANYGKDDSLQVDNTGIAKMVYKYDELGRTMEVRHYNASEDLKAKQGQPSWEMDRVISAITAGAITRYSYEGDNILPSRIAFFGNDEQPLGIEEWGNVASLAFKYTPNGQIAEISTYGADGGAVPIERNRIGDNVVKLVLSYDENGNMNSMSYYGKDDNMVVASLLNAAENKRKYDSYRRLTEVAYFGTAQDPIDVNMDGMHYHRMVIEYKDDDTVAKRIYYNKAGQEVKQVSPASSGNKPQTVAPVNNNQAAAPVAYNQAPARETPNWHWICDRSTGAWLWNPEPSDGESISWSGGYIEDGSYRYANGTGTLTWYKNGKVIQVDEGTFARGRHHGQFIHRFPSGKVEYSAWDHGREI